MNHLIVKPRVLERLFGWMENFSHYWRAHGFIKTLSWYCSHGVGKVMAVAKWRASAPVSEDRYIRRQAACATCPSLKETPKGKFCLACGCADWKWSELSKKNSRSAHACPLGLHDGSVKGGCKGCGNRGRDGTLVDAKPQTT